MLVVGGASEVLWFIKSHISTNESSAPEAKIPRLEGDHSMQLIAAA